MGKTSKIKTRTMPSVGRLSPLAGRITTIIESARNRVQSVVDHEMVRAYWQIGREIVEDEQKGVRRAEYGKALIQNLSRELTQRHGKGFDRSNLWNMLAFFLAFPIIDALRLELSWTHYRARTAVARVDCTL